MSLIIKKIENKISEQEATLSFPHFYFSEEQNENENENGNEEEVGEQEEGNEISQEDVEEEIEEIPLRRSTRVPQTSTRLHDFVTYKVQYPIQNFISYDNITPEYKVFLTSIEEQKEPNNYHEAITKPVWCKAMKEELDALEKNETWRMVPLPNGKKLVGCKWIYKIKYHNNGTIERYKARLVAKGYTQTYGIDYEETFAPVAKMNTIRILLSIVVNQNWTLHQMDVKNAFLQGTLEEEVYMSLPPGYIRENTSNLVCRLNKSIYGLKQSPRAWYDKLSSHLLSYNFKICNADH
jgi:Reverse transcriptase (RNA-dependent DNA polymerase)